MFESDSRLKANRWIRQLLVGFLVSLLVFAGVRLFPGLGDIEGRTIDLRFNARGPVAPDPRLVLIAIDEPTIAAFRDKGRIAEWPRSLHAQLLDVLTTAGAAAIGWDVIFSEPSRDPREDVLFADAIRRSGRTVLSMYQSVSLEGGSGDRTASTGRAPDSQHWLESHGFPTLSSDAETTVGAQAPTPGIAPNSVPDNVENGYGWILPVRALRGAAADIGYTDVVPDRDGVFRHIRLLRADTFGRWRSHLALSLFQLYGVGPHSSALEKDRLNAILSHPNDPLLINFPGKPGTIPRVSYVDVLRGNVDTASFRDKIVIIGVTGVGEDIRPNPLSNTANGIEITANSLDSLLQNRFIRRTSSLLEFGMELLLAIGAACIVASCTVGAGILLLIVLVSAYVGLGQWAFVSEYMAIPLFGPLLAAAGSATVATWFRLADEENARRLVEAHWQSYVGPDVLQEILHNPNLESGRGVAAEVTVVFSDIRGYSTLSEKLSAEEVVEQINEHFAEMTLVVFACGGTVLSCTGDGLLMVFGWPRATEDHADRAVQAAVAIAEGLQAMNDTWRQQDRPVIDIGLGIHSGKVVAGRVGGEQASQLTVIGDTVNVAARVQDLNKQMGTTILMTGSTKDRLLHPAPIGKTAEVPILGRQGTVVIYELLHKG